MSLKMKVLWQSSERMVDQASMKAIRAIGYGQNPGQKTVALSVSQKIIGRRIVLHGERIETNGGS
ncbi:unnamed protein product [Prunus armeniaca]